MVIAFDSSKASFLLSLKSVVGIGFVSARVRDKAESSVDLTFHRDIFYYAELAANDVRVAI